MKRIAWQNNKLPIIGVFQKQKPTQKVLHLGNAGVYIRKGAIKK